MSHRVAAAKVDDSTIRLARALVKSAARDGKREPDYVETVAALPLPEDQEAGTRQDVERRH